MLYVPCALTPAATEIVLYCLEIAADLACADTPDEVWAMAYPRVAQCFPRQQARQVLLDLRDKLRQPQTYVPTTYHWLLLYECLSFHIECLNDAPWAAGYRRSQGLASGPRRRLSRLSPR
jgi:hypothetical protein